MEYTLKEEKFSQINELMNKWRKQVEQHSSQELANIYGVENMAELFVSDGFYPYYTAQKIKILFIARECLGLKNDDYIDDLLYAIKVDKKIGGKTLNRVRFHAMSLYTAYGVLNSYPKYDDIPYASELADKFACEGGFSFAFMNISKFSNESDNWVKDERLIRSFIEIDGYRQFFADELQLLHPDIIIGMNICDDYGDYMGEFLNKRRFAGEGKFDAYTLHTDNGEEYPFLDSYHFSARRSWGGDYNVIIESCRNLLSEQG